MEYLPCPECGGVGPITKMPRCGRCNNWGVVDENGSALTLANMTPLEALTEVKLFNEIGSAQKPQGNLRRVPSVPPCEHQWDAYESPLCLKCNANLVHEYIRVTQEYSQLRRELADCENDLVWLLSNLPSPDRGTLAEIVKRVVRKRGKFKAQDPAPEVDPKTCPHPEGRRKRIAEPDYWYEDCLDCGTRLEGEDLL